MILNNTVSQAAFGYLLLTVQHLYDLGDAMLHRWSPGTSRSPCTASTTDLRERFSLSSVFYLALLLAGFESSLGHAVQPQS